MKKNKTSYYSSTTIKGEDVDYPGALKEQLNEDPKENCVYILVPFRGFKDYIFLFPSYSKEKLDGNESVSHDHKNFVFYKNKWYKPQDVFKKISSNLNFDPKVVLIYCEEYLKVENYYKIPYKYFDLTSPKQVEFWQKAIQPVRILLSKFGFLAPENRGKGSKDVRRAREEMHKIIVAAYKKAKSKRPLPIKFIQNELKKYSGANKPDLYNYFSKYTDASIRRILKEEGIA